MKVYQHLVRKRETALKVFYKVRDQLIAARAETARELAAVVASRAEIEQKINFLNGEVAATESAIGQLNQVLGEKVS